jgi:DNA repair protein SbcC/Rad50
VRPVRVELEGFSAFREPTVVDFTDADLFAFVGPTGAGKSSVIDGMIFALYGSVPRYGREGLVHPVISQGRPEARVRLDFEVHGVAHTAVRIVRRTKTGASTKEARLERGGEVLASDAPSVTAAVCDLLGLDLEQFTKCVVLPQGAFAALLHDTTSKRQDLLVKLLDLGVYEQIAQAARRRVQAADHRIAVIDEHLVDLAHATDDAVDAARARVTEVAGVVDRLDAAAPELAALLEKVRSTDEQAADLRRQVDLLGGIRVPDEVASVASRRAEAERAVSAAAEAEDAAVQALDEAREARGALGDPAALQARLDAWASLESLAERVATGARMVADREAAIAPLAEQLRVAQEAAEAAELALAGARVEHAAVDLARHLHPGDDCPVCGGEVGELPVRDAGALDDAEARHRAAVAAARHADQAWHDADRELAALRAKLDERRAELARAEAATADAPPAEELRVALAAVVEADTAVAQAQQADRAARQRAADARRALDQAARAEADARADLLAARDRVAAYGPPATGDDLAADWAGLATWADQQSAVAQRQLGGLDDERARLQQAHDELVGRLVASATAAGIAVPDPSRLRDACVAAAADARTAVERLDADRQRAAGHRAERESVADQRAVHELLATELGPRRFEAWLLEEALASLVAGASDRLEQLSSGRYAMAIDDKKQFEVIDHANADERRLARTLSGGETFLASLALALALAERVTELAGSGRASLDAIFLDEGFGTLDPDTLDVVASAIEELGASGRMVGVVSHVRELADRVPVRFEVRRGIDSSTVERVDL